MKNILLALFIALVSFPALAQDGNLKQVEAEYVCMVNDTVFDKPQIPVEVDGKTYYGCCSMCKARLEKDPTIRSALDPVSGAEVDKTEAVIGADAEGKVYYFENEENLRAFEAGTEKQQGETL